MAFATRAKTSVYLLGSVEPTIIGSMLLSRKQVLKYYLHLNLKMTTKEAAAETVKLVSVFWDRARIPMQKAQRARQNVMGLHENWKGLKKSKKRRTETQHKKEEDFLQAINRLFDIAHEDPMSMIKIAEDWEFLRAQRQEAFTACVGPSSGPDITIFKRFQANWKYLDRSVPEPFPDKDMPPHLLGRRDDLMAEFSRLLKEQQPREDYRELLELSLIVLGGQPSRGIRILHPGALHRACWMSKIIYAIKIYLFRDPEQFRRTAGEKSGIRRFVAFTVSSWFRATSPTAGPARDLQLLKMLVSYPDMAVAMATATVFGRHLWYLSERLAALPFFDDHLAIETKRGMKTVASFVTSAMPSFFEILGLDAGLLAVDPTASPDNAGYTAAASCVKELRTVNDFAERGVSLMQDFNLALTKNEEQRQFLLQVVEEHRRKYPNVRKSTVTANG
ncbi:hypothetical protein GWK47_015098 [Chionoecetes opilio]|uniref:Uncharacterized protein n=1 Tax=Chionoecetes opilio TaxID=41210 RepID=A0A8J4XVE9_CHIOP|nr:hypothetical protein GWK47_015098 [Chionoecetes opilio]